MNNKEKQPLKPCPFCGCSAAISQMGFNNLDEIECSNSQCTSHTQETWNNRPEEDRLNKELAFYKAEEKRFREEAAQSFVDLNAAREEIERLKDKLKGESVYKFFMGDEPHPTCKTCEKQCEQSILIESSYEGKIYKEEPITYCSAYTELKGVKK